MVFDLSQQPQVVPLPLRMLGKLQEMPTEQGRLITAALCLTVIRAMALQRPPSQVSANFPIIESPRKTVVFQHRQLLAVETAFQLETGLMEVVIAACHHGGPGFQADVEPVDHRLIHRHATARSVRCRVRQTRKNRLVIAEH
ncbi:hypothetical protein D3C86_1695150 [compost metagenome]